MKIAGIIAEYNPFHEGHAYQIRCLREQGFDGIVAAMSGNFVQRASTALTDKYRRARGAVASGVDLVLELPLPYAVASAEDFAKGGVRVLSATGIVSALCCGCESGDEKNRLQYEALCSAEKDGAVGKKMKEGLSYPAACREAVRELGGIWSDSPNDVLALAYRKALDRIAPDLPLIAIQRKGSYHNHTDVPLTAAQQQKERYQNHADVPLTAVPRDGNGYGDSDGFESAESIRKRILLGQHVSSFLPNGSWEELQGAPLSDLKRLERGILAYYRTATPKELKPYYGMREGLPERICRYADARDLEALYDRVKTKRFPHSAVRRAVLCGYLNIPATLPKITYLRVLAFNETGQEILREMKKNCSLPVLPTLTPRQGNDPLARLQLRGDEIFALTLPTPENRLRDLTESARKICQN